MAISHPSIIILISGYQGSGKDSIGRNLVSYWGFSRVAFADMLKDEVSKIYGIERSRMDTQEGKKSLISQEDTRSVRDILIEHGQLRRNQDGDYWSNEAIKRMDGKDKVVVTDWRFPQEYDAIINVFGHDIVKTWRVNRYGRSIQDLDYSEYALNRWSFDKVFENYDCIGKLFQKVDQAIYELGYK